MSKGMIMAIHEKRAVAIKQDGTFVEVKNKNYEIGQKISIPDNSYKKYAAMAAGLALLLVGGISGYVLAHTATSYVYVDTDSSLRLDINSFDKVIEVVPLNESAEHLVNSAAVYSRDIRTCMENIICASETEECLVDANEDVAISVMSLDEEVMEAVESLVEQHTDTLDITAIQVTAQACEEALEAGISAGRLEAVKAYTEYFGGELEENIILLEELSIRKIYLEISTAEREKAREEREAKRLEEAEQRKAEREEEARKRQEEREAARQAETEKRREEREAERQEKAEQRAQEREERNVVTPEPTE